MRIALTALILALVPLINGCLLVGAGAGAAAGYAIGEDRRTLGTMTDDKLLEARVGARIRDKHPEAHVNVSPFNGLVLLTGEAPSDAVKNSIENVTRGVEGVRAVVNELQVAGNSSLPSRANDRYVTSKVKARFIDARKFNSQHVNVITEAGTVYLMGLVKRQEANDATEIARTTSGVQRVVRVFEYQD